MSLHLTVLGRSSEARVTGPLPEHYLTKVHLKIMSLQTPYFFEGAYEFGPVSIICIKLNTCLTPKLKKTTENRESSRCHFCRYWWRRSLDNDQLVQNIIFPYYEEIQTMDNVIMFLSSIFSITLVWQGWGKIAQLCRRRGGADLAEMCRRCDLGDLPLPTLRRVRHLLADVNGDKVMKVCHEAAVIYLWVSKGRGQGRQSLERVEARIRAETQELPCQTSCYWHHRAFWQPPRPSDDEAGTMKSCHIVPTLSSLVVSPDTPNDDRVGIMTILRF